MPARVGPGAQAGLIFWAMWRKHRSASANLLSLSQLFPLDNAYEPDDGQGTGGVIRVNRGTSQSLQ